MSFKSTIKIGNHLIGEGHPPFIIAEMSGNHNGSLSRALQMVDAAAESGAHALKLQTYTADTMTINSGSADFLIADPDSIWSGYRLYDLYTEASTPWEWHKSIFNRARELGMIAFSSPFDGTAVDFLESLDVPCYKVASFECNDLPLLEKIASKGKPIIISTGMASIEEINDALDIVKKSGCTDVALLKCTSTYPANPSNSNILTIPDMKKKFGCVVGLSDHTLGIGVALGAVAMGASLVEKHFTLSREDGGVDSKFSLEPRELKSLVAEAEGTWQSIGKVHYGVTDSERPSLKFRRSVYVVQDVKAGDFFTDQNLRIIRPGYGLSPKNYSEVIGLTATKDIKVGTPLSWDLINPR